MIILHSDSASVVDPSLVRDKKTFTGLYTKWDSFTPWKYKKKPYPHPHFSLFPHLLVTPPQMKIYYWSAASIEK